MTRREERDIKLITVKAFTSKDHSDCLKTHTIKNFKQSVFTITDKSLDAKRKMELKTAKPIPSDREGGKQILLATDKLAPEQSSSNELRNFGDTKWPNGIPNVASMRMFSMLMLHAWRQRRNEVKRMQQTVESMQKDAMKQSNQLHVYSTLVRVEQKRCDELTLQLKQSMEEIVQTRLACDSLTTSAIHLTADKALLEQEVSYRKQEFDAQKELLAQTKSDLFRSLLEQRSLQSKLSAEQCALHDALQENEQLAEEIAKIRKYDIEFKLLEKKHYEQQEEQSKTIKSLQQSVAELQKQLEFYKNKSDDNEWQDSIGTESKPSGKTVCKTVASAPESSKFNWLSLQSCPMNLFYVFLFYLLPAAPPPHYRLETKALRLRVPKPNVSLLRKSIDPS